jgi:hypothetical protein
MQYYGAFYRSELQPLLRPPTVHQLLPGALRSQKVLYLRQLNQDVVHTSIPAIGGQGVGRRGQGGAQSLFHR